MFESYDKYAKYNNYRDSNYNSNIDYSNAIEYLKTKVDLPNYIQGTTSHEVKQVSTSEFRTCSFLHDGSSMMSVSINNNSGQWLWYSFSDDVGGSIVDFYALYYYGNTDKENIKLAIKELAKEFDLL